MQKFLMLLLSPLIVVAAPVNEEQAEPSEPVAPTLQSCAACHGPQGAQSVSPTIPKLAGQHQGYLEQQLRHFAQGEDGPRDNPIMTALAAELTPEQQQEFSAFYASQARSFDKAPERPDLKKGERLYKGGSAKKMIMACSACHQPTASGYGPAHVPALAGQYAEYLIAQLGQYRDGSRKHAMMGPLAARLSDEEIEAVSYYLQGVQPQ